LEFTMRRRSGAVLLTLVLSASLAACGEDRPERAVTVEPQDDAAGDSGDAEADTGEDEPGNAAGDRLSQAQVDAALLRVQDMPSGWTKEKNEPEDESDDKIEPARCQEVLDALDEGFDEDPAHEGEVNFSNGGPFGTMFNHSISTFEDEVDSDATQKIADAFGSCPEFSSTDAEGTRTTFTVSPMSFANLGDQTLAFVLNADSDGFEISLNMAMVITGHNVSTFFSGGLTGASGSDLEKLARKGMKRLEVAASS
jgi:hypothetical protein